MKVFHILLLVGVALAVDAGHFYDGAQVLTVIPKSQREVDLLIELEESGAYDFWRSTATIGRKAELLASKYQLAALQLLLNNEAVDYSIKIEDVGELIREGTIINEAARGKTESRGKAMEWTAFHDIDEIYTWMDELAVAYPSLVTVSDIGVSYEGRNIKMITISTGGDNKPAIFSESTIHAREWIAPATTTYIIDELLRNQDSYQSSLDAVDFYFVPVSNPDGYSYTWETDDNRLWRKTRVPYESCYGADPNRNFDFNWAVVGSSDRECFETYHGPHAYSENCTKVLSDQIMAEAENTRVYLAFHSAAEEWLRPWGYVNNITEDEDDLRNLCERATTAAFAVNSLSYPCVISGLNYQAGGVTDDWAYEVGRIKYSYTIELREQGYGFVIPPEHIIPSGQEMFAAFQVIFEHVRDNPDDGRT